jgi:hypothetical protein
VGRRPAPLDALADTPHVRHDTVTLLADACDIVELCVSTDEDVLRIAAELLPSLHPGARFCRDPVHQVQAIRARCS